MFLAQTAIIVLCMPFDIIIDNILYYQLGSITILLEYQSVIYHLIPLLLAEAIVLESC